MVSRKGGCVKIRPGKKGGCVKIRPGEKRECVKIFLGLQRQRKSAMLLILMCGRGDPPRNRAAHMPKSASGSIHGRNWDHRHVFAGRCMIDR